jgi:hypothetical protein
MAVDGLVPFVALGGPEDGDQELEDVGPEVAFGLAKFVCCIERGIGEAVASHGTSSSPWTELGSPLYGASRISTDGPWHVRR